MKRLSEISITELQRTLDRVERKKPAQRLIAAIAYKNGVSQTELANWFDLERRTIYSWFKRLEDEPLEAAIYDESRSGRPRKLTDDQQRQLQDVLQEPPTAAGYDEPSWTPALVGEYLDSELDVAYSRPSCRRLMKEAGLRYQQPSRAVADNPDSDTSTGRWLPEK